MVAIRSSSGFNASANAASLAFQAAVGRTRLAQAEREARDAQATANDLRAQAQRADQAADNSQRKVDSIASQNNLTEATYARQLRASSAAPKPQEPTEPVKPISNAGPESILASRIALSSSVISSTSAAVNARYANASATQSTGRNVSVTA
jgi:hypothetical protein